MGAARRLGRSPGVVALWAIGWLAVPPLLKHQVQKIASEKLGRTVTLGAVDFKPWSMELTLSDLAIATADGKADQVRIQRIYIDGELQSLVRMAPVVDAITVDGPVARLTHLGGGRYDIDDMLKKARTAARPAAERTGAVCPLQPRAERRLVRFH
jgi:uncharacterized protein involved in outer membrane biogenesis